MGAEIRTDKRTSISEEVAVESMRAYVNGEKYLGDFTLNAAASMQRVITKQEYLYSKQNNLFGGEMGLNYARNRQIFLFTSYARSFNVPNID